MKHTLKLALIVLFASCSNGTEKKKAELIKLIKDWEDSAQVYSNEFDKIHDSITTQQENEFNNAYNSKSTAVKLDFLKNQYSDEKTQMEARRFEKNLAIAGCRDKIDSLKYEIIKLK